MRGSAGARSLVVCAILVAGCGGDDTATTEPEGQPSSAGATSSPQPATAAPTTSALTTSPAAGRAGDGHHACREPVRRRAVRRHWAGNLPFRQGGVAHTGCYEGCAEAWPPVLTEGPPAAAGVNAELLGTTTRTDGATQVTYGGHPLYFYAHEGKNVVSPRRGRVRWSVLGRPQAARAPPADPARLAARFQARSSVEPLTAYPRRLYRRWKDLYPPVSPGPDSVG